MSRYLILRHDNTTLNYARDIKYKCRKIKARSHPDCRIELLQYKGATQQKLNNYSKAGYIKILSTNSSYIY